MLLDFFVELIRGGGGPELSTELLERLTRKSANFWNLQNDITLKFMIFAELYFRRTLELFFNKGMVPKIFKFLKVGG